MLLPIFLLLARQMSLSLSRPPGVLGDIGTSFTNLATYFVGFLAAVLGFILMVNGYHYMTAGDDIQAKTNAKRGMGAALGGAVLVGLAVTLAIAIQSRIK
jgi:uncharacterized membrane protein YjfL (UPF0719 family)